MSQHEIDRRSFGRQMAVTAAAMSAAVSGWSAGHASNAAAGEGPQAPQQPNQTQQSPEVEAPPPILDVPAEELLLALLRQKYSRPLSDEQVKAVRSKLASIWQRSAVLSSFALDNGDEPATVFAAYRG